MAGRGGRHRDITGQVGTPPPPGAPIESAAPIQQAWVDAAARLARQNEQTLPDFAPKLPAGGPSDAAAAARAADAAIAKRQRPSVTQQADGTINMPIILTDAPSMSVHPQDMKPETRAAIVSMGEAVLAAQAHADAAEAAGHPEPSVMGAGAAAVAPPLPPAPPESHHAATDTAPPPVVRADQVLDPPPALEPHHAAGSKLGEAARNLLSSRARTAQPAASNTDSPSRGIPTQVGDPGKRITGGFGDQMDQQYFPLDGNELREVILGLMDKLVAQLQNDLRFTMAMVYPRVSATVSVNVVGYTQETDFSIPKRAEHLKTPVEIAEAAGAVPVEIQLENNIAEFSEDGQSLTPPNTMRRELGLQVPKKQRVAIPTGYAVVDRLT